MKLKQQYPVFEILDSRSAFFCPAKWQELYLYLNHGTSNSCHHPLPHAIPQDMLDDPWVLHNTPHKLAVQQQMLQGQRPDECHMCWHIEDLDDVPSDRIWKSQLWQSSIPDLEVDRQHVPPFIEVVFDNHCNLTCSYCDAGQSSRWAARIHRQPLELQTDYRQLYSKIHIAPGSTQQPYFDAWRAWWPQIQHQVRMLKVSGGEPTMSPRFWQLIDDLGTVPDLELSINSNFSVDTGLIKKLAQVAPRVGGILAGVSLDAVGTMAEYARQGLDYALLRSNLDHWLGQTPNNCRVYLQSTVTVLNVWQITDMFDLSLALRQQYPERVIDFYSTVVRFPEFQSVNILPEFIRRNLSMHIHRWYETRQAELGEQERIVVQKLAGYLENDPQGMHDLDLDTLQADFVRFLLYYEQSSRHRYQDVYPPEFLEWVADIQRRL